MRYCEFCGNRLEDGKVCDCKEAQLKYAVDAPAVRQKKPGGLLHVIIGTVIVAAAILLVLNLTGRMSIDVDLRDVVQVSFRGVDSKGILEYKVGWSEVNGSVLKGEAEKQTFESQVRFTPDWNDGLSNGDTVTIRVECPEEVLKECGVRLMQDKLEFKVEGLKELDLLDFFADVEVSFEGVETGGVAMVSNSSTDRFLQNVTYDISQGSGLSNGDVVTLTAIYDEAAAEAAGIAPEEETQTYTVEGLSTYVRNPSQLTEAFLEDVDRECRDILTARILSDPYRNYAWMIYEPDKTSWDISYIGSTCKSFFGNSTTNGFGIDALTQEALYVACRKDITEADPENNFVAAIYRMDAHDGYQPGTHTLYYLVRFSSVLVDAGGAVSADLLNPHKDTGNRALSMDTMYQKKLMPYLEKYTMTKLETAEPEPTPEPEAVPEISSGTVPEN